MYIGIGVYGRTDAQQTASAYDGVRTALIGMSTILLGVHDLNICSFEFCGIGWRIWVTWRG
jgi:hypothetical protein